MPGTRLLNRPGATATVAVQVTFVSPKINSLTIVHGFAVAEGDSASAVGANGLFGGCAGGNEGFSFRCLRCFHGHLRGRCLSHRLLRTFILVDLTLKCYFWSQIPGQSYR